MGLFDFASNIGSNLFESDDEAAEKIRQHIEERNPGIANLGVTYEDNSVTLTGQGESSEATQKAILMAGNTKGVKSVTSYIEYPLPEQIITEQAVEATSVTEVDSIVIAETETESVMVAEAETGITTDVTYSDDIYAAALEAASDVEYYEIQSGDTLGAIAKRYYGNANDYTKIFEANQEVIIDPDKIFVGQKIRIPVA